MNAAPNPVKMGPSARTLPTDTTVTVDQVRLHADNTSRLHPVCWDKSNFKRNSVAVTFIAWRFGC